MLHLFAANLFVKPFVIKKVQAVAGITGDFDTLKRALSILKNGAPRTNPSDAFCRRGKQRAGTAWRAKVELSEEVRGESTSSASGTISGVAHKLGVHRRMVRPGAG